MSTNTSGNTPKEEKKKKPFTLTFRICINTPSGSSSRECCIPAQDCFKGPRLAAVAEPHAPQVGTIEQSKVEKAISIRGSATLWATTEAPAEPEQTYPTMQRTQKPRDRRAKSRRNRSRAPTVWHRLRAHWASRSRVLSFTGEAGLYLPTCRPACQAQSAYRDSCPRCRLPSGPEYQPCAQNLFNQLTFLSVLGYLGFQEGNCLGGRTVVRGKKMLRVGQSISAQLRQEGPTLRQKQNGQNFANDIFRVIF